MMLEQYGKWCVSEDGVAKCPRCGHCAPKDEYTGKPIISRYCPDCGKWVSNIADETFGCEKKVPLSWEHDGCMDPVDRKRFMKAIRNAIAVIQDGGSAYSYNETLEYVALVNLLRMYAYATAHETITVDTIREMQKTSKEICHGKIEKE